MFLTKELGDCSEIFEELYELFTSLFQNCGCITWQYKNTFQGNASRIFGNAKNLAEKLRQFLAEIKISCNEQDFDLLETSVVMVLLFVSMVHTW